MMSSSFFEKTIWSFPAEATSGCVVLPYVGPESAGGWVRRETAKYSQRQ
jgi:hypothetical protein